jgi:hypothetical protein
MVARIAIQANGDFGTLFLALNDDIDYLSFMPHLSCATQAVLNSGDATDHEIFETLLADVAEMEKKWNIYV